MDSSASSGPVRILFVISDEKKIKESINFLTHHGHTVKVARSFLEAFELIESFEPQAVLLSWSLKDTEVKKTYNILTESMGISCIVFAEESSAKTSLTLMNSGIHHHLLPPLSGGAIHTKIESLLRSPRSKLPDNAVIVVSADDVDPQTQWEQAVDTIWRGRMGAKDSESVKFYYFKGPRCPEYDDDLKRWRNFDEGKGPILMQERPQSEAFSMTQKALESKLFEHLQKGTPASGFSIVQKGMATKGSQQWTSAMRELKTANMSSHLSGAEPTALKAPQESLSVLSKAVKDSLKELCQRPAFGEESAQKIGVINKVFVLLIMTLRFRGYLVFCGSDESFPGNLFDRVAAKMAEHGEGLQAPERLIVDLPDMSFLTQAQDHGDFLFTDFHRDHQVAVGYWSTHQLPQFVDVHTNEAKEKDLVAVDLGKNFVGGEPIPFDLYLDMEKNHKILLYVRQGGILTESKQQKLLSFQVKEVYIKKDQKSLFLAYCARNKILMKI